ncbi:MAG: hypothetical protein H7Y17_07305 [Chlorobia bacterium]|nr:hypothetical protein [Fimbriimonadaceae bacterium]
MKGTVLYIWHNDSPFYDEVRVLPGETSEDEARGLALLMMVQDEHASHIHVEVGSADFDKFPLVRIA